MELKITKEKVLEAASKCSTAKETLETLFPEAFKSDTRMMSWKSQGCVGVGFENGDYLLSESVYRNGHIHLSGAYNWEIRKIGTDNYLIPTKKP